MREALRNIILSVLRLLNKICSSFINIIKIFFQKEYWNPRQTYYPEFKDRQKKTISIIFDQIKYILKYVNPNKFYFLYGFDIKGLRRQEDYVDAFNVFAKQRNNLNITFKSPYILLRDKSLFGIVAEAYGVSTPRNIGIIHNDEIYIFDEKTTHPISQINDIPALKNDSHFFIKTIDGECADGVYHVIYKNNCFQVNGKPIDFATFFERGNRYLLQKAISNQHPEMSILHPQSINTIRLCTVYNKHTNNIEVLSCVLRVGTGENKVDNWAAGGLSIGVDTEKGVLREYGFYKPGFGTKAVEHPDSGIVFKDYNIPYLQEAIEIAKDFHSKLYGIHSIGWDIAITEDGPCFVEGNDNWEISLMQISNHGLQKEFNNLFY